MRTYKFLLTLLLLLLLNIANIEMVQADTAKGPISQLQASATTTKTKSLHSVRDTHKDINFNVAVVDVQKVLANSTLVSDLNKAQIKKLEELQAFVDNAKTEVEKETNKDKKKVLEDGYNKQLNDQKSSIDKEFAQKTLVIEKSILQVVEAKAKGMHYDLVLTKNNVLFGGNDITDDIINSLK